MTIVAIMFRCIAVTIFVNVRNHSTRIHLFILETCLSKSGNVLTLHKLKTSKSLECMCSQSVELPLRTTSKNTPLSSSSTNYYY